jgi:hypothetical protein
MPTVGRGHVDLEQGGSIAEPSGADLADARRCQSVGCRRFLGITVQQLEAGYGHHHPDCQREAIAALGSQNAARNTMNETRRKTANVIKIVDLAKGK